MRISERILAMYRPHHLRSADFPKNHLSGDEAKDADAEQQLLEKWSGFLRVSGGRGCAAARTGRMALRSPGSPLSTQAAHRRGELWAVPPGPRPLGAGPMLLRVAEVELVP